MKSIIILFALFSIACQSGPNGDSLPAERPKDLKLLYHFDGGMRYYFEDFSVEADSCVYDINDGGRKRHIVFPLSTEALDGLYNVLQKNNFDKIAYHT